MSKLINLIGQRFGRLKVVSRAENSNSGQPRWNCICDCGEETTVEGVNLRSGYTKSCGCLQRERTIEAHITHGMRKTPTYKSWTGMKNRCSNPKYHAYNRYGERGIMVCERWMKFEDFYEDMGEKPKGMSIERIDNNGNYCPENCCWATKKNQARNTRRNKMVRYQGKTQCLAAWVEELGINYGTLWNRLQTHSPQIAFNV